MVAADHMANRTDRKGRGVGIIFTSSLGCLAVSAENVMEHLTPASGKSEVAFFRIPQNFLSFLNNCGHSIAFFKINIGIFQLRFLQILYISTAASIQLCVGFTAYYFPIDHQDSIQFFHLFFSLYFGWDSFYCHVFNLLIFSSIVCNVLSNPFLVMTIPQLIMSMFFLES